ncbi:MAG: TrmH family RNA methyltransferase [Planctomycetota bacterium]
MQRINSAQNQKFKDAMRLHTSRGRKKQQRFIVFGSREISRALNQNRFRLLEVYIHEDSNPEPEADSSEALVLRPDSERESSDESSGELLNKVSDICKATDVNAMVLNGNLFSKLNYGQRETDLIAVFETPDLSGDSLDALDIETGGFVVVLEGIEKPGNLGAIIRSADGAGCSAVILADCQTGPLHPNSIRNSVGTVFSMPMAAATASRTLSWMHNRQIKPFAAIVDGSDSVFETDLTGSSALILGNEAAGLSEIWRTPDVNAIALPMLGTADSLNVAASGAIMIYEARRQRLMS